MPSKMKQIGQGGGIKGKRQSKVHLVTLTPAFSSFMPSNFVYFFFLFFLEYVLSIFKLLPIDNFKLLFCKQSSFIIGF